MTPEKKWALLPAAWSVPPLKPKELAPAPAATAPTVTLLMVPAWAVNRLPGRLPVVGRLFSPEREGGVLAATLTLRGPFDDPAVHVNPLAALLPGALRTLLFP